MNRSLVLVITTKEGHWQNFHIPILYPADMSASSQSMLGMLNGFTLDPGISDQFTDISIIGIPNLLHR